MPRVDIAHQGELEAATGNEGQAGRGRVPLAKNGLGCCETVATVDIKRWGEQRGVVQVGVVGFATVCAITAIDWGSLEAAQLVPAVLIGVVARGLVEDDAQARQGRD